jgi:hypothetical protein
MPMPKNEKETFWQRYKFYIIGLLGAVCLLCFFGVQSVSMSYRVGEKYYTVKMEYTMFDMCLNCMAMSDNAGAIVEKEMFAFTGKKESVKRAAKALQEIAGTKEGEFVIRTGGVVGNSTDNTKELVAYLETLGYEASVMQ